VALAEGACERLGADFGVGITGIAGPGGGTEEKPVGLVWLSVARAARDGVEGGERLTRKVELPGGRVDVRDRATTVAMHLLRRVLDGSVADSG
jgi:nicotinamide-nucleotide amidase